MRRKERLLSWVVGIVMVLATIAGASAAGDEKYVKLLNNTDSCLIDCETVYEVIAADQNIVLNWDKSWWFFRDSKNKNLRDSSQVSGLLDWNIYVNDTRTVQTPWIVGHNKNCTQYTNANGTFTNCTYDPITILFNKTEEYWRLFAPFDKVVNKGEKVKIRIVGRKNPRASIDNVFVLELPTGRQTYDQWAWWNTTFLQEIPLKITNNNATVALPANYTITVSLNHAGYVTNGTCSQADGDDLRIVFNDSLELHRINITAWNTATTHVAFATVNPISGGTSDAVNYSIYCGDSAASNPPRTLDRVYLRCSENFDYANGPLPTGWVNTGGGGQVANITNNALRILGGGWRNELVYCTLANTTQKSGMSYKQRRIDQGAGYIGAGILHADAGVVTRTRYGAVNQWNNVQKLTSVTDSAVCDALDGTVTNNVWYNFTFNATGSNTFTFWSDVSNTGCTGADTTVIDGNIGFSAEAANYEIDEVRFYLTHDPDPTINVGSPEQQASTESGPIILTAVMSNATIREIGNQSFQFNVTFNTTLVVDINATFYYNSVARSVVESTITNSTGYQRTIFNSTFGIPLVSSNASVIGSFWEYAVGYANGSRLVQNTTNGSHTVHFGVFWNEMNRRDTPIIESNTTILVFNITLFESPVGISSVNSTWNGTFANLVLQTNATTSLLYNLTRSAPLVANNGSLVFFNSTFAVTFNGTTLARTSVEQNQSVVYGYFLTNHTLLPANLIEGETVRINASLTKLVNVASTNVTFTYNGTARQGSIVTNTSTSEVWSYDLAIPPLNQNNLTATSNASMTLTFNGTTITRTNLTHTPNIDHTQWKMILTDCGTNTVSTNNTLNFTIYSQQNTAQLVSTTSEDLHTVYTSNLFNRSYGFSRTNRNNWTICIYPYFPGASYNNRNTVQFGDGTTYGIQTRTNTTVINLTTQTVNLYVANLTESGMTLVTITVEDSSGIDQAGVIVEAYRYYLTNNTYVKVFEGTTNEDGETKAYLRLNDVFYNFRIYDETHTSLLHQTANQYVFDNTLTLTIGTSIPKGWDLYAALLRGHKVLTYNNASQTFSFYYDFTNVGVGNFSITEFCLRIDRGANESFQNWTASTTTCNTALTANITSPAIDSTLSDYWRAVAYVNITASPAQPYILGVKEKSFSAALGVEGVLWASLIIITMASGAFFNPVVAVILGAFTAGFLGYIGVISPLAAFIVAIIGGIVIFAIKA